jgi:hypothetical protein
VSFSIGELKKKKKKRIYSPLAIVFKAKEEFELLKGIQAGVESYYVDGRPRHHLPSARELEVREGQSCLFVAEYKDALKLSQKQLLDIFKHRHILLLNSPHSDEGFGIPTMIDYANVWRPVSILGKMTLPFPSIVIFFLVSQFFFVFLFFFWQI